MIAGSGTQSEAKNMLNVGGATLLVLGAGALGLGACVWRTRRRAARRAGGYLDEKRREKTPIRSELSVVDDDEWRGDVVVS